MLPYRKKGSWVTAKTERFCNRTRLRKNQERRASTGARTTINTLACQNRPSREWDRFASTTAARTKEKLWIAHSTSAIAGSGQRSYRSSPWSEWEFSQRTLFWNISRKHWSTLDSKCCFCNSRFKIWKNRMHSQVLRLMRNVQRLSVEKNL